MPTYEYRCAACGNVIEVFQRIGDEPLTICDVCGGALRKVFHPAGIVFKGSGFYATDSRASAKGTGDGKAGRDKAGDGGSGDGKAAKPEAGSKEGSSDKGGSGKSGSGTSSGEKAS